MTSSHVGPPRPPDLRGQGHGASQQATGTQKPWYRRTWKRVAVTMVSAAALGAGAGMTYHYAGPAEPSGAMTGVAREDLSGTGRAVTEYPDSRREEPVKVTGTTLADQPFSTEELLGDVVVLNVWGSWCAPCRSEAPVLVQAHRNYSDEGVSFAGINVRDNRAAAIAFERRYAIPYPSVADPDGRALLGLNEYVPMSAVPVTLVLDREGRVAARVLGELREATVAALLDRLLAEPS